jgi:hypothetical protein
MSAETFMSISTIVFMPWYCFTLFYMVNFLRKSGESDLSFVNTIILSVTGKVGDFYKLFIHSHSKNHSRMLSQFIAYSNITSIICLFIVPFTIAILENLFI